ncbi:MAG: flagellar M-ring protein FliF [Hungatella sp.]|nr:flagellar M-ring protein FliF [Hungatella sp.]
MQNLKERWQGVPEKTRKIIKAIAGGTIAIALIAIVALNLLGNNPDYSTLFTGLSQEEAQQVVGLLQDEGIEYRYNAANGAIRVPETAVEKTRVNLLSKGYPKSGFAYDMYLDNTGLMTTESDKKLITKYELQDRLGATIRVFDGVQDAKVTINEGADSLYAWEDQSGADASASVVVTMKDGVSLTSDKAQAVKTLISRAVKGMNFTNVSVFDAATMMEVGGDGDSATSGVSDLTSLTSLVESNIAANVRRVLERLYGSGNVAVSVKGKLNMERLIQESTQYTTPEKIDEEDKTGLLDREDLTAEGSNAGALGAGGVVGADANADTPRYTNETGTEQDGESYSNSTASREWLYNMVKEQRQIDPGVLEDTSIGIVVITDRMDTPTQEDLVRLVANAAGIPIETAGQKVTIIRDSGPVVDVPETPDDGKEADGDVIAAIGLPLPILIAIAAGILLLILLLVLLLILRSRKKKKNQVVMEGDEFIDGDALSAGELAMGGDNLAIAEEGAEGPGLLPGGEEEDEFAKNEEILNLRMQRSLRLKQNIAEFVDQNPQIAAKLVQGWLRGEEEEEDGRNKHSGNRRKQS